MQRVEQCLLETRRVAAHFTLPEVGTPRSKGVFDRTFNRHDVTRLGQVDFLDQGGQRRGLAATGRAADEDQTVVMRHEFP